MSIDDVEPAAYLIAFGGGVVSFLSPCVLPLVPAYLAIVTGLDVAELESARRGRARRVARSTGLFIGGFSAVFILLGLSATTIGQLVFDNQLLLTRLSGALVLGMGLFVLGSLVLHTPGLYRDARFHPDLGRCGAAAPGVAGIAFGFGWSPCIGPVLGSILTIAATQGRAWAGGTLLAAYSLGLGVPFLISGLIFGRLTGVFRWLKQHLVAVTAISGGSLVFFGVLLVFNRLVWVTTQLQTLLRGVGLDRLIELG